MQADLLHYELIKTRNLTFEVATAGRGDKVALLLHGFPECAHSYRYQIPLLARLGYRVWAPNLRGYGRTDKPQGRRAYAIDQLEQDITDLIDASGARSVLLVGHDWGGALAWSYAIYGPRPIHRLVVMNAPHPIRFRSELLNPIQLMRSWYMLFFQLPWLPEWMLRAGNYAWITRAFRETAVHKQQFSDADLQVYRQNAMQPGALTSMVNWYRAMPWSMALMQKRGVRSLRVPTLLLWGEQDRFLSKRLAEGTERLVTDLSLRFVPDASHWVQQDAPAAVNALMEEWLRPAGQGRVSRDN